MAALNTRKYPHLYSTVTELAYRIGEQYYGGVHYVWCTTELNSRLQPSTSNPLELCNSYLKQVARADRHATLIESNKTGILKGAKIKYDEGLLSAAQYDEIRQHVAIAGYDVFLPILIIAQSSKVKTRCEEVMMVDRASDTSVEYIVRDLRHGEYVDLHIRDLLSGLMSFPSRKAGE